MQILEASITAGRRNASVLSRLEIIDLTRHIEIRLLFQGDRAPGALLTTVLSDIARTGASDRLRHVTQRARTYTCTRESVLASPTWCACGLPTESR